MFNSIGRSSNFAQAGKSAADDMVRSFAAARRNSPDYGKLAQTAATIRSQEKQAAMKAAAAVTKTGIQAAGNVQSTKIKIEAEGNLKKSKRKAGALATAGQLFGTAGSYAGEKRSKREVGSEDSWYENRIQKNKDKAAELRKQAENYGSTSKATDTTTATGNTGGNGSGKVNSTTDSSGGSLAQSYGKNWHALQTVIRQVEGTRGEKGYNTRYGGHQFEGFDAHPNIAETTSWGTKSEAAGAFQFMKPTWDHTSKSLGLTDFSPKSQQEAGRYLTQGRGVNPDADLSDFNTFASSISKLSPEWAGLPNSTNGRTGYHGQANADMKELHQLYLQTLNGLQSKGCTK